MPNGGLAWVHGQFYGTTGKGGKFGWGTLFAVNPKGQEGPVLSVQETGGKAGVNSPVRIGEKLYATTSGGAHNAGSVIEVDLATNRVRTLYSFAGGKDGAGPDGSLITMNNTLYGTTAAGGASNRGTIFALTPAGVETIVHAFTGCADGETPNGGLVNIGGTLYGTTYISSTHCSMPNSGVVFAVTP